MKTDRNLPDGWEWKKLGEICDKPQYGYTTSASYNKEGPLFVRTTDITSGNINWKTVPCCDVPPCDIDKYLLNDGDVLISRAGSVGASVVIKNPQNAIFASYLIRFKPTNEIISDYLGYFLKSQLFMAQIGMTSTGTTLKGINATNLAKVKIPVPALDIQQRIVDLLDSMEHLRYLRKETLDISDQLVQSVFLEMFGDPLKNPMRWQRCSISDVVFKPSNINLPKQYPDTKFAYVDIASIDNRNGQIFSHSEIIGKTAPSRARRVIQSSDVLVSTVRPYLNAVALVPNYLNEQICSTGFCILRSNVDKIVPEYLFYITRSQYFIKSMVQRSTGANYPAIKDSDILNLKISLPPLPLQQKFADFVQSVEDMKSSQVKSAETMDEMFNSFLDKAFRGELIC